MRYFKKFTSVVVALAIGLTSMSAAFASTTTVNESKAVVLNQLDLYAGTSTSSFVPSLETELTRGQGAVLLTKMFNMDSAALALTDEQTDAILKGFADAKSVPTYAEKRLAYLVQQNIMSGSLDGGKLYINADDSLLGGQFATLLLKQMGYSVPSWKESLVQLSNVTGAKDIASYVGYATKQILRDQAVGIMYGSLTAKYADGLATIIEKIVAAKPELKAVAVAAGLIVETPSTLAVDSVKALNLKQVEVVFNKEVDSSTVVDANFTVYKASAAYTDLATSNASFALQSDKKTVIITLDTNTTPVIDEQLDNNSTFEVKVSNVKDLAGNLVTAFDKTGISSSDISTPVLVDAKVSGPRTIVATFSEPVKSTAGNAAADFTVDGGNYYIQASTASDVSFANRTITLTLGAPLTSGDHTLTIASSSTDLKDHAGYPVITTSKTITSTPVTTAPVATIASQSQTKVVVKFSAPVNYVTAATIYALYNNGTYGVAPTAVTSDSDGITYSVNGTVYNDTWDLTFAALPAGTNNIYITSNSTTPIADAWGNTFATSAVALPINIAVDTTAPTVKSASIALDSTGAYHQLTVVYSEDIKNAGVTLTLNDSSNAAQTLQLLSYTPSTATAVYNYVSGTPAALSKLAGGTYTLTIKNIVDQAPAQNTLDTYTNTITVADVVAPTISASYVAGGQKILVTYSEAVNTAQSGLASSYQVNGGTNAINSVSVIDAKNVILNVATALGAAPIVKAANVADLAGNSVSSNFSNAQATAAADNGAVVLSAQAISTTQIKVEFDRVVTGLGNSGMSLVTANATNSAVSLIGYTESTTVNSSNHTVAIFHLATALNEAAQDTATLAPVTFKIVQADCSGKDYLGVAPANTTLNASYNTTTDKYDIADAIAPTVKTVAYSSPTTITITFNENLDADTINKAAGSINGFSLKNGTIGSALQTSANTIVITAGKDANGNQTYFTDGTTSVSYNGLQGIQDVVGNALAAFSDKVAD
jgi:hypothetical protein